MVGESEALRSGQISTGHKHQRGCRSGDTVTIGELSLEWDDPDDASLLNAAEEAEALELDGVLLAAAPNNDGESEG